MLTINVRHDPQGAVQYFKEGLTKEGNYYLDKTVKATWKGTTSQHVGLQDREVNEEVFGQLAANIDPRTGKRLTVRNGHRRRSTIDWTFSAPKSVSIAYALTKDGAILQAHQTAYQAAMKEVEKMIYTQANTQHHRGYTATANIIYAAFDHEHSRPVALQEKGKTLHVVDPQLHTHCVMMNTTWNPKNKRFEAVELFNAHTHSAFVAAAYHATLSLELEKAGYQTQRTPENFKLAGISREVEERFSLRTQQIEKVAKEKGITNSKTKGELGAKTRVNKGQLTLNDQQLYTHWKNRLSPTEWQSLQSLKGKRFDRSSTVSPKGAVDQALAHYLEREAVFNEKRLIAHATSLGYGQLSIENVRHELQSRTNMITAEHHTITLMTTREMVKEENKMIALATAGKGKFPALNKGYIPKQGFLNTAQRKAIQEILGSYDQTVILSGAAGVGKTSLLTEVRQGIAQSGKQTIAVAPSSQAAEVLEKKGFESATIAALLSDQKLQKRLQNNVLLIDEAGMCGVKSMTQLLELAKKNNSRTILSGDIRQHGPPGQYGDALRILQQQSQLQVSTVDKIVRQQEEKYNQAIQSIAQGKILKGYQQLDKMGSVVEIADQGERIHRLAEDYVAALAQKRSALIISPTHFEGDQINAVVREKLKQKGHLQGQEKTVEVLSNISLTNAQKQECIHYQQGHIIRFHQNTKGGFQAGSHHEVITLENDPISKKQRVKIRHLKTGKEAFLPRQAPANYGVYHKRHIALAKSDRIRLTHNTRSLEGTKMNNGTSYTIKGFSKHGIALSNGKTIPYDLYHMGYGYCETSHAAQGKDAHSVFLSLSEVSGGGINDQTFYVASSRGTHSLSIYTSDKEKLQKAIMRSGERLSAGQIDKEQQGQQRQKAQEQRVRKQRMHHKQLHPTVKSNEKLQRREKIPQRGISHEFTKR